MTAGESTATWASFSENTKHYYASVGRMEAKNADF